VTKTVLTGVSGTNPLGFLAAIGVLRLLTSYNSGARLAFLTDSSFCPVIEGFDGDIADVVASDAARNRDEESWLLTYEKTEKKGVKRVADLKAPPDQFRRYLASSVERWLRGDDEAAAYAAAFGTSVAVDGRGNTKPTAFHFTAANQKFLDSIRSIRQAVDRAWAQQSLFDGAAKRPGTNVRWDPAADRNWALMAEDPTITGTQVDAPLEWLAFRGLPLLPSIPIRSRISTTGVTGRGDDMRWTWPLWSPPASLNAVRSLLTISIDDAVERRRRGIDYRCTVRIRRSSQGFGNFGPSFVQS
jgi:hypothetical protein